MRWDTRFGQHHIRHYRPPHAFVHHLDWTLQIRSGGTLHEKPAAVFRCGIRALIDVTASVSPVFDITGWQRRLSVSIRIRRYRPTREIWQLENVNVRVRAARQAAVLSSKGRIGNHAGDHFLRWSSAAPAVAVHRKSTFCPITTQ